MVGHPAVPAFGQLRDPVQCGRREVTAGKQPEHRRQAGTGRGPPAVGSDQVPGGSSLLRCEIGQQLVCLWGAESKGAQAPVPVGTQVRGEPIATATNTGVVRAAMPRSN